ncbi:MAG: hypothetical protein DMF92_16980 [Acidobacteria bacterium]|nr:MAG: hypothetical protein DMF92_16980 [Acidobacteriota bacterium]
MSGSRWLLTTVSRSDRRSLAASASDTRIVGLLISFNYSYTCPLAFAAYHLGMPLSRAYRVLMAQDLNVSRGCAFA